MNENEINAALQEIAEASTVSINEAVDAFNAFVEALAPMITSMFEVVKNLWEGIQKSSVPPKWWHYYKHAKKARTHKKYYNRIQRYIAKELAESQKEPINESD